MFNIHDQLPNGWYLKDYQIKGIEWLLDHPRAILADDMGLGKTVQTLVACQVLRDQNKANYPIIVIAPVSLLSNWKKEAKQLEIEGLQCYSWAKFPTNLPDEFILVFDEAHYMKSLDAKRTQSALSLSKHKGIKACWLLSGTPMSNGLPSNLFPLLLAVQAGFVYKIGGRSFYENTFCNPIIRLIHTKNKQGKTITRQIRELGVNHLAMPRLAELTNPYILRRRKEDCLKLQGKQRIAQWVDLRSSELRQFKSEFHTAIETYKAKAQSKTEEITSTDIITAMTTLRQLSSHAKVPHTVEMVSELVDQGESVVVFVKYKTTANMITELLNKEGITTELLTGDSPQPTRQGKVDRFQSGESKVFVSTIDAGGVGLTLTKACYVIMVDRDFLPENNTQAEDRCYRLGQEKPVFCYWLSCHALDIAIDSLNEDKDGVVSLVLGDKVIPISGETKSPMKVAKVILDELAKLTKKEKQTKPEPELSLCN